MSRFAAAGIDGCPGSLWITFDAGFGTVEAAVLDQTSRFSQNFWRRDENWGNRIVPPADWSRIERNMINNVQQFMNWVDRQGP